MKFNKEAPAEEAGGADDAVLLSALMSTRTKNDGHLWGCQRGSVLRSCLWPDGTAPNRNRNGVGRP